jgi:hypothetical protein
VPNHYGRRPDQVRKVPDGLNPGTEGIHFARFSSHDGDAAEKLA